MSATMLAAARAEALFLSDLSASQPTTRDLITAAVRKQVRDHHGVRGCAADVAAEYGHHPDTAPARMCWCLTAVAEAYGAKQVAA
jgi:hypothetical protein